MNTIQVNTQLGILRPANEVFEAIVDNEKMSGYFITSGSERMAENKTVTWEWKDYNEKHDIKVQKIIKDEIVSFLWLATGIETLVEIKLEARDNNSTLIKITETEWQPDEQGIKSSLEQTQGWCTSSAA
jgi:uncharacterized protein YndB with AHSA1/START domain